ncbi:restriction endonuclease subunit S [Acinetobacter johnsonii]|uniref:Type I restriction modification DNA specificity domain protein n=2 Tax=Acinetobacter johnsonii TaxID=40214 RepID=D0SCV4_ACIJO|nr:restriction endonuclease subunit S [Acinetobacter johnsonii]EEY95959.1 type I restriction modification DNA specificity domain protein [Acinetobacter johnsonii SH046]MCU4327450.1 restriction endonuclease subunit S [Acinetobacter johnsonii]MDH0827482.1 restriction endonuclease subunit S [Acinetobacter johnsonii]
MSNKNYVPLNEFILLQRGFDLPQSDRISGDIPVVASTGVAGFHNEYKVDAPGVVIGRSGSIGGGQYIKEKFWPLNTTLWVKDFKGHDARYVYYLLKSIDFHRFNVGTGVPTLNRNHLSSVLVKNLGYINEKVIAKTLGDLDDKIHLNNQINQTLESIAQALFKSWFIDFDPVRAKIVAKQEGNNPEFAAMCVISGKSEVELQQMAEDDLAELRATAALFPDELVESELGEVPKGWEVTRFSNIVEKYIDNRGKTPPIQSEGIPLLEVKHLPEFSLNPDLNTDKKVSLETFNTWFRAHLQENDLIMSTVGTIGRLCIVPANRTLAIAQNILGLRFKLNKVNPLFMYYQMNSAKFRNDVDARLVITVQSSIKRKDLETIDLLQPDIKIQNIFAEKIKPFVLSQQSDESLKLIDIRDALLPKLLSGEITLISDEDRK